MQTHVLVAAISATPINFRRDNSTRSSQVPQNSMLQITRCLDSASDSYQAGEINTYSLNTPCFIQTL